MVASKALEVPHGGMFICRPKSIKFPPAGTTVGITLLSDLHIGARNVDYKLIAMELEEAKSHKDRILLNGDVLDMILVQDKKRFRSDVLHPRLSGKADLINGAVDWAVELLGPYADLIDMVGLGNHEECVAKYHGIDVTKNLVYELRRLRKDKEHIIHYGGYCGFVRYLFKQNITKGNNNATTRQHFDVFYHHGSGGAAPVTKGMIDLFRTGWVDADLVWLGHKHNAIATKIERIACSLVGDEPDVRTIRQVMTGAYFDTYRGQSQASLVEHGRITNYAADRGMSPQGKGGARVLLTFDSRSYNVRVIQ